MLLTYAGTVKRHNVYKRHVASDSGFKLNVSFFSTLFQWDKKKCNCFQMYNVQKLSANFGNHNSQDSH